MSNYDNTNRGAIWPNDRMREGKQDPQFTGSLNVDGVDYWVSAWKRKPDAKQGSPSLSFSLNRKEANKAPNPNPPQQSQISPPYEDIDDFEDDIPF